MLLLLQGSPSSSYQMPNLRAVHSVGIGAESFWEIGFHSPERTLSEPTYRLISSPPGLVKDNGGL